MASLLSAFTGLALPSKIYAVLIALGSFSTFLTPCESGALAASCFGSKATNVGMVLLFGAFWTAVVEMVYRAQWHRTAWALSILPLVAGLVFLLMLLGYIPGLH